MHEPIYFYTKTGPYFELSNFAPFGFESDGVYWPTVEHYFQAQKFTDSAYQERIRKTSSPREARSLGQSRSVPIRSEWESVREAVMLKALRLKFQRPERKALLLGAGEHPLVEASPFDHFWGAGQDGSGQNRLGHLLVQLRRDFVSSAAQPYSRGEAPR